MSDGSEAKRNLIGVYTKTVVRGSARRWVLRARIRSSRFNDVVFVGEDSIDVKQVGEKGQLRDIAWKDDFDAHIRAAAVFDHIEDDFLVKIKSEADRGQSRSDDIAPQSVVLTLDSQDLVFIFLVTDGDGTYRFIQQTCPMPCFDRVLFQPGEHLAVDPSSRALAVAANENQVVIYTAKSKEQIQHELRTRSPNWLPITTQRPMQVNGVIQNMQFLNPAEDDEDHVILLLVVIEHRRTKAVRIDWYQSSGPASAQIHPGLPLESARNVPSLLIPLREASFLLVTGTEITRWRNILSGMATEESMQTIDEPPNHPGISGQAPLWTSWANAPRTKSARRDKDFIYLVREDGLLILLTIGGPSSSIVVSKAGDFKCHVGSAFASLGDEGDPDIFAVAGETSSGQVVSMGMWPSFRLMKEMSRSEATSMVESDVLPNWASVTDMISSSSMHSSKSSTKQGDTSLVTSGRQPYGTITELRHGIRARMLAYLELDDLRTVTDVWTVPTDMGDILVVLSSPLSTRLLVFPADSESEDIQEVSGDSAFDSSRRTLAAGFTLNGRLIQVTSKTICATPTLHANFEDTLKETLREDTEIITASIIKELSVVVTAERSDDACCIACYGIPPIDSDAAIQRVLDVPLGGVPLCLAAVPDGNDIVIVTSTHDRQVACIFLKQGEDQPRLFATTLPREVDPSAVCDHIAVLQAAGEREASASMLAVCGLRDGNIAAFSVRIDSSELLYNGHVIDFGNSTVKLTPLKTDLSSALAMSGSSTCLLSWDGRSSQSLTIEDVWITDRNQPEFAQGSISACTQTPDATFLASDSMANAVMMISGDALLVATLDPMANTVPRQIPVSGSPNRLIYSRDLRCLVCASLRSEVKMLPSDKPRAPPEEKRQLYPTIDFIPTSDTIPSHRHDLQPGERDYALLEWTLRQQADGKKHTFILIGGSYISNSGKHRGRITFLQPVSRNWEVKEVREMSSKKFDEPVYSMAMYDPTTYIACSGDSVYLYQLSAKMSWDQRCPPYRLNSPGVHLTVETDSAGRRLIVISTANDSLVTLHLTTHNILAPSTMGPRAHNSIAHYTLPPTSPLYSTNTHLSTLHLLTTKTAQLLGLASPPPLGNTSTSTYTSLTTTFCASLSQSLTRLTPSLTPSHRGPPPLGLLHPVRITGCTPSGALLGILIIDEPLWRRLSWLQKLIGWSEELSPHSYHSSAYSTGSEEDMLDDEQSPRVLPIGLLSPCDDDDDVGEEGTEEEVVMYASTTREEDMHIDGDVLSRVLRKGGKEAVERVLEELARREDAVGGWMRRNVRREMDAVEEIVEEVRKLEGWVM